MDTGKGPRDDAEDRQRTPEEERRDQDQREQVEAQAAGDTTAELKAFAREVLADNVQFPKDIVEDSRHPERRVDEEQGTASQPGSEPAESRREK